MIRRVADPGAIANQKARILYNLPAELMPLAAPMLLDLMRIS
jgi:hypothetical protein